MSAEEIKKYKSFIMRHIHERNLDALRMVGDTFKFIVNKLRILPPLQVEIELQT